MKDIMKNSYGKMVIILCFLFILSFNFGYLQTANAEPDTLNDSLNLEQVKLNWIVPGSGDQEDNDAVEKEINLYLEEKINATLDLVTCSWGEYDTKLRTIIAAGMPFDINFTSNWSADYRKLASYSVYKDITDMLDTYAPKTKALLGKDILKGAEINGRIYAVPVYNSSVADSYGILLNNNLVKKYKIDTTKIKKLQDLEPILKTIKAGEKKTIAFYPFFKSGSDGVINTLNYDKLIYESPGAVLRDGKSTKVINEFESNDAQTLFSLMNKWYKAGYIPKSASDSQFYVKNNKNIFAMYSKLSPVTCEYLLSDDNIDMVPVQLGNSAITTTGVTTLMQAISSESENPERALMLLELVNTDKKLSNLINFGIEGLHYKKTGTNTITQLPKGKSSYNPSTPWIFGNETLTYSLPGRNPDVWKKLDESVKTSVASPLLGFAFDPAPVSEEVLKIGNIRNKYLTDLSFGKVNPATTLSKMNSEMKKAGLQKVLTEMQKQVDKFKNIK